MIINYQNKKYSVIGENEEEFICTLPWEEEEGEAIRIPKNKIEVITKEEINSFVKEILNKKYGKQAVK